MYHKSIILYVNLIGLRIQFKINKNEKLFVARVGLIYLRLQKNKVSDNFL